MDSGYCTSTGSTPHSSTRIEAGREFLSGILPVEYFEHIITLSLGVSLCATTMATLIGLSLGAALAVYDFPGRRVIVVLCNAFFGLPPVTVGLALYLLLSRSGPLGLFGLLFTPGAMVLAQTALATPIVTACSSLPEPWYWLRLLWPRRS
jgi:tungstate transport system permease protein